MGVGHPVLSTERVAHAAMQLALLILLALVVGAAASSC